MGNRAFANMIVRLRCIKLIKKNNTIIILINNTINDKRDWHPPVFFDLVVYSLHPGLHPDLPDY